jgi:hypothetical protein
VRSVVPDELISPSPQEIIWAAGLFEGEGSVFPERRKGGRREYVTPRMSLNTTDFDVIQRFHAIMGGKVHKEKKQRLEQKQQWKWSLWGYAAASRVLELWRPWLGERRIRQFEYTISEVDRIREDLSSSPS